MTENEAKGWLIELKDCEETQEFYYADCIIEAFETAIQALEEIQQYREIGTIEELKTLKEKSVAKKQGNINDFDSHLRYPIISLRNLEHCPRCGQKLDWQ